MALSQAFQFCGMNASQRVQKNPKQWWKPNVWKQAESLQNLWSNLGTELEGLWDKISQAKTKQFTLGIGTLENYISSSIRVLENAASSKDYKQSFRVWAKEFYTFFLLTVIPISFKNLDTKRDRPRSLEFIYQKNPKNVNETLLHCALELPFPLVVTKPTGFSCLQFNDAK